MSNDLGFSYRRQKKSCLIFHNGKQAAVLRGRKAAEFYADLEILAFAEQQQLMARLTGNYKRGNERQAKNHPRNRR